ncbi:MAG: hypothetical protein ABF379_02870 [Akkermansiaceae bacterium]
MRRIGRIATKFFQSFGCRVLVSDLEWLSGNDMVPAYLEEIFKGVGVVPLHLLVMPDTYHLIDEKIL